MPFDGLLLHKVLEDIRKLVGAKVDKISQPSSDTLVMSLRSFNSTKRLMVSTEPNSARIQFTSYTAENPATPPMFTMLLRKHLMGAKLSKVLQFGADRIAELVFLTINELGDEVELSLVCELMGRRSNIILLDSNRHIIDALHRVDMATNASRPILSKLEYTAPPSQGKLNPINTDADKLVEAIIERGGVLSSAILATIEGCSPLLARELSLSATHDISTEIDKNNTQLYNNLKRTILSLQEKLFGECNYTCLYESNRKLLEFSFIDILQYDKEFKKLHFNTSQELLDEVYKNTAQSNALEQKANDLNKTIKTLRERLQRKLARQQQELENSIDRAQLKKFGDLLSANLYKAENGAESIAVEDFYSENYEQIIIPLNSRLTPSQNAQKYYSDYKKLAIAEKMLSKFIEEGQAELAYLDNVLDSLQRTESMADIAAIREELINEGLIRSTDTKKQYKQQKPQKLAPKEYLTSDGHTILCGRNNTQNDALTTKLATNYDIWCHIQHSPGSHTILVSRGAGDTFSNRAIEEACIIAACNSQGWQAGKVAVDYTTVRNVKKPRGARPGMVTYTEYSTAYVTPNPELEKKLRVK